MASRLQFENNNEVGVFSKLTFCIRPGSLGWQRKLLQVRFSLLLVIWSSEWSI